MELELTKMHHKTQKEYKEIVEFYLSSLQYKIGQGFKNTNQLIDRVKLLGGSIMAGNNGVIPEFTQISNYLNTVGVLPTNELNKMMKTVKMYLQK